MNTAQKLYQLQQIEQEIESGRQSLASLKIQLGNSPALISAREKAASAAARMEELKKEQHSLEWEVEDIRGKLAVAKESLYSGRIRNPKELSDIQQEEKSLETRRNQLEDKVLELMEQSESAAARIKEAQDELAAAEKEWKSQQQDLLGQIEKMTAEIAALAEKQRDARAAVNPEAAEYYSQLKQRKGWPIARIEQGTCCACRISLSTAELQRARGQQLVECASCHRILCIV
jgi:predicted  nucleic acid-binding Zn-ribbon protein